MNIKIKDCLYPVLIFGGILLAVAAAGGETAGTLTSIEGTSLMALGAVIAFIPVPIEKIAEWRENKKAALSAEADQDGMEREDANGTEHRKSA